jgi:hypothetical protein
LILNFYGEVIANMRKEGKKDWFKVALKWLYIVSLTIYAYFLWDGIQYYLTDFEIRPHHEAYRSLRPAGFRGHGFGIVGSVMMLLMLLYSVRKRTKFFGNWGPLSRWLDIHIYLGIMGPLLVILHTTFKLNGIVAVSFWSMIAVSTSGIVGRYLYLQIPRNQRGDELSLKEIDALNEALMQEMVQELGLKTSKLEKLQALFQSPQIDPNTGLGRLLLHMLIYDLFIFFRKRKLRAYLQKEFEFSGSQLSAAVEILLRKQLLQRRILLLNHVHRLFHYWHVFHKPFAVIMFLIMFIHIGVAVWLGYTWIF